MAWVYKGKRYSVATYRKAIVSTLGTLLTLVTSILLLAGAALPVAVVAVIGTAIGIVTGIVTFLVKNAKFVDAIDGYDPEDTF